MSAAGWKNTKKLLWLLIASTRGGVNRARIMILPHKKSYNVNQLAEFLSLDYTTVRHHLEGHDSSFSFFSFLVEEPDTYILSQKWSIFPTVKE
jgi:hypothetical protein